MKKINDIKDFLRRLLWLIGLRPMLPKSIVNNIIVNDNGEKMVPLVESQKLKFYHQNEGLTPFLREQAAKRLQRAALLLPDGYSLLIFEAFRSINTQKKMWNDRYTQLKLEHPNLDDEELTHKTRLFIAEPTGSGPHQSGGAVDVSLLYKGQEVDMGTNWCEFNEITPTKSRKTLSSHKTNRLVLLKAMDRSGFVNYPNEWWHFSFGDKMWAAYTNRKKCQYGSIGFDKNSPSS